jgi:hypothetical protein
MVKLKANSRIGFIAKSGYGKTYFADYITQQYLNAGIDCHVYNTNFETLRCKSSKGKLYSDMPPQAVKNSSVYSLNRWLVQKRANFTNCMLRIEDMDVFFNGQGVSGSTAGVVRDLFSNGRHQGIGVIYTAKNLKYIPLSIFTNTDMFYLGQFTEQDDVERAHRIGIPDNAIRNITDYVFVQFDRDTNVPTDRLKYVKAPSSI